MKVEYTTKIQMVGNSCCVIIPKMQMDLAKIKKTDVVKVTVEKVKE